MSQPAAYRHWVRALSLWPKDRIRPHIQFQEVMQKRIDRTLKVPEGPDGVKPPARTPAEEKAEMEQINALYSIVGNRYKNKFPLSQSYMEPAVNPEYYTNLMRELDEVPDRSLLAGLFMKLKNRIRWK